jgi:hypothetical protein
MKLKIPDALKADIPPTLWGRVLAATPVVMAVVATLLAGLASSEMSRAQYDRSLAAQQQSKAGDQWSYFQAKRLRGTGLKAAGDLLQVTAEVRRFDPTTLEPSLASLARGLSLCGDRGRRLRDVLDAARLTDQETATSLSGQLDAFADGVPARTAEVKRLAADLAVLLSAADASSALAPLCGGDLPSLAPASATYAGLEAALEGVQSGAPEGEIEPLLVRVSDRMLGEALGVARGRVRTFETRLGPTNDLSAHLDELLARQLALAQEPRAIAGLVAAIPPEADPRLRQAGEALASACLATHAEAMQVFRDFTAARLRYASQRYDAEAILNQSIANLYELQVRKNNISAERHRTRSQRFFYGMLAAQTAVIIATLAMAARQRNLLWSLAAAAGLAAVSFAVYVLLSV